MIHWWNAAQRARSDGPDVNCHAGADPKVRVSRVLDSMRKTPRHRVVPAEFVPYAYDDRPVPIGYGQTIRELFRNSSSVRGDVSSFPSPSSNATTYEDLNDRDGV